MKKPQFEYQKIPIAKLPISLLKRLCVLSYKGNGMLTESLKEVIVQRIDHELQLGWSSDQKKCLNAFIVVCRVKNRLVGWGLRNNAGVYNIVLFVQKRFRRRGIGTQLYKRLKSTTPQRSIRVAHADQPIFFAKMKRI